jgi:hypothetical protein
MFYKPKKCESCGHKIHPFKDAEGKVIWQNLLYADLMSILLIAGMISLLIGFNDINKQCFDIVRNPCNYTHDSLGNDKCMLPKEVTPDFSKTNANITRGLFTKTS